MFGLCSIFKIARYIYALDIINSVFKSKHEELLISLVFTLFLLIISYTFMKHLEHDAQSEDFSSIPETMWWGIATLTIVGYGVIYPVPQLGKLLGGFIVLIVIGLFALPTDILALVFRRNV